MFSARMWDYIRTHEGLLFNDLVLSHVCLFVTAWIICHLPGSSIHGIFQARILEWVAISYSRGSSLSRDRTCVSCISCIGRHVLYHGTTWETPINDYNNKRKSCEWNEQLDPWHWGLMCMQEENQYLIIYYIHFII